MKTFILILIFFIMYLLIQHFINENIYEGVCNKEQDATTFNTAATIEQQQKEIDDFKKSMEGRLSSLKKKVVGFNTQINENVTGVSKNAALIKSTVQDVNAAKDKKAKELDALTAP
jgi:vacuolar-type H+-ATPase subunit I/STV1